MATPIVGRIYDSSVVADAAVVLALARRLGLPSPRMAGLLLFAAQAALLATHLAIYQDRWWAIALLVLIPFGKWGIIACSVGLMVAYTGIGYSDQIDLARAALERVLAGNSPYGVMLTTPGSVNPFGYGPLAMITAIGGQSLEVCAAAVILVLLARERAWVTLGLVAGFPPFVYLAATGINDYVPAAMLVGGLLLLRTRRLGGAVLLALAIAVKPYAGAWLLPVVGLAGWQVGALIVGLSAVLWSPLLVWGFGTFAESLRLVLAAEPPPGSPSNAVNLPWLRLVAIPIGVFGLATRRWEYALLLGAAVFALVMFSGKWASLGYWVVVLPLVGLAIESLSSVWRLAETGAIGDSGVGSVRATRT